MAEMVRISDPEIDIRVTRRANARRITLRIGPKGPTMTLPTGVALSAGQEFAERQAEWLAAKLAKRPDEVDVAHGVMIPIQGEMHEIVPGTGRGCRLGDGVIKVGGAPETCAPRLAAWMKSLARERLVETSDEYAAALRRAPGRITLRDTRSRWGSCSSRGDLMFSWRLIMAPPEVLDYVSAHEAAHLVEMNHSSAFWSLVARICPDFDAQRAWLRRHGADLHRYRFQRREG